MEKKFKVLRFVAVLYKIIAWIVAVTGVICALGFLAFSILGGEAMPWYGFHPEYYGFPMTFGPDMPILTGIAGFLIILIVSALYFVLLYAVSEVIYLGLAIEENTRETAYYLRGEGVLPPQREL